MKKFRLLLLALAISSVDGQGPIATPSYTLTVQAYVDGDADLHIHKDYVYWYEGSKKAYKPGRYNGANLPTYLNGVPWLPHWHNGDPKGRDKTDHYPISLNTVDLDLRLMSVGYSQQDKGVVPRTPINTRTNGDDEYIVEIPDKEPGAMWYTFTLTPHSPAAVASPVPNQTVDWQKKAVSEFPDLANAKSDLNHKFIARVKELKTSNPAYFNDPKWPYLLAQEVSGPVNVPDLLKKAIAAAEAGNRTVMEQLLDQAAIASPNEPAIAAIRKAGDGLAGAQAAINQLNQSAGASKAEAARLRKNAQNIDQPNPLDPRDTSAQQRAQQMRQQADQIESQANQSIQAAQQRLAMAQAELNGVVIPQSTPEPTPAALAAAPDSSGAAPVAPGGAEVSQDVSVPQNPSNPPIPPGPDPDFLKVNTVFKPLSQVVASLKAAGFDFDLKDNDTHDPDAPDVIPVKGLVGKTHESVALQVSSVTQSKVEVLPNRSNAPIVVPVVVGLAALAGAGISFWRVRSWRLVVAMGGGTVLIVILLASHMRIKRQVNTHTLTDVTGEPAETAVTNDTKWIAIVYHLDQEVVRVMICQGYEGGNIPGASGNISITAIRPSPDDVKYAVDKMNSLLTAPFDKDDTDNITTFYKTYVDAQKVRVLFPHADQSLLEVLAAGREGDDEAMWGLQVSAFKGAYEMPTYHTDNGDGPTSVWIDEGDVDWLLTADVAGETALFHKVRSKVYHDADVQELANAMGASVPSESVETTVDKVPLDGVHLKNFCDATKKWFDANKPNAPLPPSNDITSINDDYFLSNDGDLNYYYKPNDYTDSTIVSFGRGNAEEIEFLLWLCAQPKFETRQQAIHAVYAKWQSFLDYKTSLLAK